MHAKFDFLFSVEGNWLSKCKTELGCAKFKKITKDCNRDFEA